MDSLTFLIIRLFYCVLILGLLLKLVLVVFGPNDSLFLLMELLAEFVPLSLPLKLLFCFLSSNIYLSIFIDICFS